MKYELLEKNYRIPRGILLDSAKKSRANRSCAGKTAGMAGRKKVGGRPAVFCDIILVLHSALRVC